MAKICCAIETEPKTLREGLLNHAREVAAHVVQNLEPSDASSVFTQGVMRPVIEAREVRLQILVEEEEKKKEDVLGLSIGKVVVDGKNEKGEMIEGPCQCSLATIAESPQDIIREPLSAPF